MKIKKLLSVFILLICIIVLSSCNKKTPTLMDYSDVYAEVTLEEQKEMEKAYYDTFGEKIKWSMPNRNKTKFKNEKDFKNFRETNSGARVYLKHDNKFVLSIYVTSAWAYNYWSHPSLCYDDDSSYDSTLLTDNSFGVYLEFYGLIYSNGSFEKYSLYNPLKDVLDISFEEALEIKERNNKFNEIFYNKFLTEEELENNDYRGATDRYINYYHNHKA
ncbi:MAG: hypothetical protein IKN46_03295 [Acholeplasmatales bacterium]|nr:hypothetical protein [Acholeplasmatales bacterium]